MMIDGPGVADRLADDDEDAGADDRADAQRGEVEDPDGALEPVLGVAGGVADEDVVGLAGEGPGAGGGGHEEPACPPGGSGQTGLRRPVPASHASIWGPTSASSSTRARAPLCTSSTTATRPSSWTVTTNECRR